MKIKLDSRSAERLKKHDVGLPELKAAHIIVFDVQAGAAITLPFPILGPGDTDQAQVARLRRR